MRIALDSYKIIYIATGSTMGWPLSALLYERQRKVLNRLLDAGPEGFQGGMTTRKAATLNPCSAVTASRDPAALAVAGLLESRGAGRSTAFPIPWHALIPA